MSTLSDPQCLLESEKSFALKNVMTGRIHPRFRAKSDWSRRETVGVEEKANQPERSNAL